MVAKISRKINIRAALIALSLTLLILEVYVYTLPLLSSIAFLLYVIVTSKSIGERLSGDTEIQWWSGSVVVISAISLINVIFYYSYKITPETSLISLFLPLFILIRKKKELANKNTEETSNIPLLVYFFGILEILLIAMVIHARNGELMPSPWLAFNAAFFIVFAIATTLYVYLLAKKTSGKIMLIGTIIHFFIFYCIAAIVYKLGFGFDGFIHRATESWILQHGFIDPKEPFYIGQYGLVVTLSRITGIAIKYIDIFFVPVVASISIPTLVYITFPKIWKITKQTALVLSLFVPFAFFLSFNLTTPHNLALLLTILISISLLGYYYNVLPYSILFILSLFEITTHPLLGAPVMCIVIFSWIIKKYQSKKISISSYIIISFLLALLPIVMFTIQQWLGGYGVPTLTNPLSHIGLLKEYFVRPFWYKAHAAWYMEILYTWQYAVTPVVILFSLLGAWYLRKTKIAWLLLSSSIGFCAGAFLLRTLVTFPNVSFHEQGNYPLRLLIAAIVVIIPLGMYGIYKFSEQKSVWIQDKLKLKTNTLYILGSIKIGVLLMLSLYFAYPQYNSKVYFPGFNVTEYDKKVVETIHNKNTYNHYVVLSTILTAVTSLTEYPFANYIDTTQGPQFYYSIPAGGPLYILYEEMLYQGQKRKTIDKVFDLTHVNTVYFVVPWYWKNSDKIVEGAKKTADVWQSIDNKMWIFEYLKKDN